MKLKLRKEGHKVSAVDKSRATRLVNSMQKLSIKVRRKELKEEKSVQVLRRDSERGSKPPSTLSTSPTKVKLNVIGNKIGMHNAGDSEAMRKVRAMRKIYNKQMPVLACSNCQLQNVCPQFKAGYECAYLPFLNSHKVENERDLVEYMKEILGVSMRRIHQTLIMEQLSGATPSLENSEQISLIFNQFTKFHELIAEQQTLQIETEDKSVIGRLFGGLDNLLDHTKESQRKTIDVEPVKMIQDKQTEEAVLELSSDGIDNDLIREHAKDELDPVQKEANA